MADNTCKGWNFHVYALGSDVCSLCGQPRHSTPPPKPKGKVHIHSTGKPICGTKLKDVVPGSGRLPHVLTVESMHLTRPEDFCIKCWYWRKKHARAQRLALAVIRHG